MVASVNGRLFPYGFNFITYDDGGPNIWDDGSQGNYWSDYREKYPDARDADGDGIWDVPYEIPGDAGAKDNYPMVKPFEL